MPSEDNVSQIPPCFFGVRSKSHLFPAIFMAMNGWGPIQPDPLGTYDHHNVQVDGGFVATHWLR